MQTQLLQSLAIVAGVGVLTAVILGRFRLPTLAGLIAAGALVGPHGLGLIRNAHAIDRIAEAGVILLLFTIGLELSLERLKRIARMVVIGGSLQVGLTILAAVGVAKVLGEPIEHGIFFGFLFSMSSTAIVLRALSERGEVDAPHGRLIVGTLIFQDLCVVPMVLIIPILGGQTAHSPVLEIALALGKAGAVLVGALAFARLVLPRAFALVDASRSRELFLLAVLGVCIGTAWLTSLAGLSLALGAFLAGVVLADSDYRYRALSDVLPLRDAFGSLFFISLGMLLDVQTLLKHPAMVALFLVGFLVAKSIVATIAALVMRFPARVAMLAGAALAQLSELGFVLAPIGVKAGLITATQSSALLSAGVISMFVTPLVVRLAPRLAAGAALLKPLERLLGVRGIDEPAPEHADLKDHVVVVGYGLGGVLLERALSESQIQHVVLELNAEQVRRARDKGVPIYYGDASSPETLEHARVSQARALVLMINDPEAARRAVDAARHHCPQTPVILRTRYVLEVDGLEKLGAADVVCEELEAGVEMLARVLRHVGAPGNVIKERVREARQATQRSARDAFRRPRLREVGALDEMKVDSFLVRPDDGCCGATLVGLQLRTRTRALVVAVRRGGVLVDDPDPADPLQAGDTLFLVGSGASLRAAMKLLEAGKTEAGAVG
jgi:CPA2 family monovalent cation:H+ antiporter-2